MTDREYLPRVDLTRPLETSTVQGGASLNRIDQCRTEDSQLVGTVPPVLPSADVAQKHEVVMGVKSEVATEVKRKRGRPPRMQGKVAAPPLPQRKTQDEEDVCFICFDGGSLVLCDRRGCPKAYHPACIKRDEAFFQSKAKWNCGWHICSTCQKASHYLCYTCTFSLCKGCTKDADYVCVRQNKGFCGTCMRTIMLIENIPSGNQQPVKVDFDDKTSWEYLFKVYWIYLKENMSLTVDELIKAKNPWKGDDLLKAKSCWKGVSSNGGSPVEFYHNNGVCADLEANHFKRRKIANQLQSYNEHSPSIAGFGKGSTLPEGITWATKELVEFVAHMKNGDTSIVTQFDVQVLLLEYIKRNNLRDPHQKSQIVCDSRLMTLFGKARVGHLEMLKLLEYHFPVHDRNPDDTAIRAGVADVTNIPVEVVGNSDSPLIPGIARGRKTRKKTDDRGPQINPNPDEYADIDVHNINLIYLKRALVENLLCDAEKFQEKVVGSFVRIRVPIADQKQDIHRLVKVVGTSKAVESYSVGTRITNVMLEILNLDKKELVSIEGISNQDFTEDECKRLRQSIKFGLIERLKVGEVLEKAQSFRAVKIDDCLEAETLRLNHLRDLANEKGQHKELRECVEKIQLLKSPMERQRRLLEVPIVHTDPTMNPSYEAGKADGESDNKKQGECLESRNSGGRRKRKDISSPLGETGGLKNTGNMPQKNSATSYEPSGTTSTNFYVDRDGTARIHEMANHAGFANLTADDWKSHTSSVLQSPPPSGREMEAESEKVWHYQDPTGKVQGPFPMAQLRKWSTSMLFPLDLRVWRTNEKQENSILLTDVLAGVCNKEELSLESRNSPPLQEVSVASNDTDNSKWENKDGQTTDGTGANKNVEDANDHCNDKMEIMRRIGLASLSPSQTPVADVDVNNSAQVHTQNCELSKESMLEPEQPCTTNFLPSSPPGKINSPLQVRESHMNENTNGNFQNSTEGQSSAAKSNGKQVDVEDPCSQSMRENCRPPSKDSSASGQDSKSVIVSAVEPTETCDRNQDIFSDLPCSAPNKSGEQLTGLTTENRQTVSPRIAVLDSGPSWSTASSLVGGGARAAHIPEVAAEWGGYSATPAKPILEEWSSHLVSASSIKLTEGTNGHAAPPTSGNDQLTHPNPTHPTIDLTSWHSMVPDPSEFCSLADESVSDLLAEVEAMESLNGLPSPTSKMRCELAPGPDNECFSPVEGFSPVRDQGKGDALSSSADAQIPSQLTLASEILLQLSHYPHFAVTNAPQTSQISSQLAVPEEPQRVSNVTSQSTVMVSEIPSRTTFTDLLFGTSDHQKSSSGNSSSSAEAEGGARPSDVSVNQWEERRSEIKPPTSTRNQEEAVSVNQPGTLPMVRQWNADSGIQRPAPSIPEGSWGTMKGNINASRVEASPVTQASTNTVWATGHGPVQHQANANPNPNPNPVSSTANVGSFGSQPRYGGDRYGGDRYGTDRYSGSRDHRNHFQGRDTSYGRDSSRSSWNSHRQQPFYGVGNGGSHSHKPPPKGQRVCKFYESGNCKRGSSCSFWHPQ